MNEPIIAKREVTRHILRRFDIRASKRLGQNFLVDETVVSNIAAALELRPGDPVLEIGAGIGTLTQALALTGAQVTAVEIDRRFLEIVDKTLASYSNIRYIHGDIMELDIAREMGGVPFRAVGNLPYYITTPILMSLIEERLPIDRMAFMVQKEVAQRLVSGPGSKDYGSLSVAAQFHTEPEILFYVPPTAFIPEPAVESAVVLFRFRKAPAVDVPSETDFFRVVKSAFAQRRKTLSNSLKGSGFTAEMVAGMLDQTGIDGGRRGETLSLDEFALLARNLSNIERG